MEVTRESAKTAQKIVAKSSKCTVEANTIVPDKNPDILKILQVDATCSVTNKTMRNGRISVEGKVCADVIYLPEGDCGITVIPTEFDFSDVIECPTFEEGMHVLMSSDVSQVDINLVNSRKISVQATIVTDVEVIAEREIEYISSLDTCDAAYKTSDARLYSIVAHDSNEFVLKEQVELPGDRKEICNILKCDARICDREVRASGNKVIVKGAIASNLLYMTEGGLIDSLETSFPFTEVFEVPELDGGEHIDVRSYVSEKKCITDINPDGERKIICYEFAVQLELFVTKEKEISYISDCFFFGAKTDLKCVETQIEDMRCHSSGALNIREIISFEKRLPKIASVYNVIARPVITSTERKSDHIVANGRLEVSVLYLSENEENPVCCQKSDIPISHKFYTDNTDSIAVYGECERVTYALTSGGDIELRASLELKAEERRTYPLKLLTDINRSEDELNNEIIIFFSGGEDTVWDIAKKYKVAPEALATLNDLDEGEVIEKGRRIIIPGI